MPFVKLDCGILNSTLWFEREAREIFITALLMAEPYETTEPLPQIAIGSLEYTGWSVPPGWYGFVPAASVGIIHRAKVPEDVGLAAIKRLGDPEDGSRSSGFDGRRLVRVDGGFIVLNYMKYRERDYTTAERSKRYRARVASRRDNATSRRDITQAEAEAEVQAEATTTKRLTSAPLIESHLKLEKLRQTHAFVGSRLRIPNVLHDELRRKCGTDGDAKLREWYLILDADVETSGEAIPDIFSWLRPRFVLWCEAQGLVKTVEKPRLVRRGVAEIIAEQDAKKAARKAAEQ